MKKIALPLVVSFLLSCQTNSQQKIEVITTLPTSVKEASACEVVKGSDLIWTVEDQHNPANIYGIDHKGKMQVDLKLTNVENVDWEDLTSDDQGNLYVGDFGNNDNDRQDLAIYKVDAKDLKGKEAQASQTVQFYFPEQTEFPPKKKNRIFDVESFFFFNNNFYLVSKNRSAKFDGTTTLYKVANQPGKKVAAEKIEDFKTCNNFNGCAVTSAAISPDKKKMAILTSDKVWVFSDFKGDHFFSGKARQIDLGHYSQKEGICFQDNQTLLITDEADKKGDGHLYLLKL